MRLAPLQSPLPAAWGEKMQNSERLIYGICFAFLGALAAHVIIKDAWLPHYLFGAAAGFVYGFFIWQHVRKWLLWWWGPR